MEAAELRNFSPDELSARVKQWKDELFRTRFKAQASETRDTSTVRKLRRDIARALTVMTEIKSGKVLPAAVVEDKPVKKTAKTKKQKKD